MARRDPGLAVGAVQAPAVQPPPELPDYPEGTTFQVEYEPSVDMFKFSVKRSAQLVLPEETVWVPAHFVKYAALTLMQSQLAAFIPGLTVAPVAAGSGSAGPQLVPE